MLKFLQKKTELPTRDQALSGRVDPIMTAETHFVSGHKLKGPYPDGLRLAMFGMGCFWGVEKLFWPLKGVFVTAVGYAGGLTPNPTYREVCSGKTGHNEVVRVVYDPNVIGYPSLLKVFWEGHNPTQGMRQGNDVGTQYRSGIYTRDQRDKLVAEKSRDLFGKVLEKQGQFAAITTEIIDAPPFYFAEDFHQQYLAKNPNGYCGLGGTGVVCPSLD